MKQSYIRVMKIVLHDLDDKDMVWVFTSLRLPIGDYHALQIPFPKGEGVKWIARQFNLGPGDYEILPQGFEVCAPV
jgi:hypothetical protein